MTVDAMTAKKIVFIHTVNGLAETFQQLCAELAPGAGLCHIADESLIQAILAAGGLTPAIYRRVCDHVVAAEQAGASVVQLTCSSISPCAGVARHLVAVPVLKIDEPMIEKAVSRFDRIGIIATNPATLGPTAALLREKARLQGRSGAVESVLCQDAYAAFFAGDLARHDRIVRDCLRDLMGKVDAVLLAQASMARVADLLDEKERTVPIFSSPRPAMEHLAAFLNKIPRGEA